MPEVLLGSPEIPAAVRNADVLTALLARIAQQDHRAFEEFVAQTSRYVRALVAAVVVSPDLSEDACQEVYLQVWQTAARFDPLSGTATGWLNPGTAPGHRQGPGRTGVQEPPGPLQRPLRYPRLR
jgi:hypothetical protein